MLHSSFCWRYNCGILSSHQPLYYPPAFESPLAGSSGLLRNVCHIPVSPPYDWTNLYPVVTQRRPVDRMIYHFVALMQLLLFATLNAWITLQFYFVHSILQETHKSLSAKILFYTTPTTAWMMLWHFYGWVLETRWWPSRDCLTRLLPPWMVTATVKQCRYKSLFYQLWLLWQAILSLVIQRQAEALRRLASSYSLIFLIIIYPLVTVLFFFSGHGAYQTVHSGGARLPVLVFMFNLSGSEHFVLVLSIYYALLGRLLVCLAEYAPSTSLPFSKFYREHPWFNLTIGDFNFEGRVLQTLTLSISVSIHSNLSLLHFTRSKFQAPPRHVIEYCVSTTFLLSDRVTHGVWCGFQVQVPSGKL